MINYLGKPTRDSGWLSPWELSDLDKEIRRQNVLDEKAMAKKRAKKRITASLPQPAHPFPSPLFDPGAPTKDRPITRVSLAASTYKVSDETEFTVTPIVLSVRRVIGKYNELGQPLYIVNVANSIVTKAPKKLMRPRRRGVT
jgi:hypothetical protein